MSRITSIAYLVALFISIICGGVWSYGINDPAAPVIQAAQMSKPPTIDGKVDQDEWKGTAGSSAIHEMGSLLIVPSAPTFHVGYDHSFLYVSAEIPIASGTKLKAQRLAHDGPVWTDDAVEIFIDPKLTQKDTYQFLVNSIGSIAELKNQDMDWNGEWQAVASQSKNSWSVEIRIPFKTLELDSITDGSTIGFNIGFDRTSPANLTLTWAPLSIGGFHQPDRFGHLMLSSKGPAITTNIHVRNNRLLLCDILPIYVLTPITSRFQIIHAGSNINQDTTFATGRFTYVLPEKDGKVLEGDYEWKLEVANKDDGKVVCRQSGITQITTLPPIAMSLRKYFLQGKLAVDIDASGLRVTDQPISLIGSINDQAGNTVISKRIKLDSSRKATVNYDVSGLSNIKHIVKIEAKGASGSVLEINQADFIVPPKPVWLGSKAGMSDKVLAPWKPLKTKSINGQIVVASDGRTYQFSGSPMPDSVITANASILAGPVTMKLSVDGKEILVKGRIRITKKTDAQVVLRGLASAGSLKVDSIVTIDFDGNTWVDLKLYGNRKVTIDSFIIDTPVKSKHAKYRYYYPDIWGKSENARALEPAGWGAPYVPFVWVGDDDRGFALYSTSDQNWRNRSEVNAVKIMPMRSNTKSIRFSVITEPIKLSAVQAVKGLKYKFGFEATPNKTPDKDVWDYRIVHSGNYGMEKEYTSQNVTVRYTGEQSINLAHGSVDMWVRVGFDPTLQFTSTDSRGSLNRDLLMISSGSQQFGLYWNIDDRGMHFFAKNGTAVTLSAGVKNEWQEGELHHLSLTWNNQLCLYVDGQLMIQNDHVGLIPETPGTTAVSLTVSNPGFEVDELRVSDVERKPEMPKSSYIADVNTLLLDHYDEIRGTNTTPAKGTPGKLRGAPEMVDGKFGKALGSAGKPMLILDYLKELGVKTICFHEHWTEYQNYTDTIHNQENLKNLVKACHERGIQLLLYFGYLMADICPEWDPYHLEVLVAPQQGEYTREPRQKDYSVCYNSAWQDFLADGIDKVMTKYDIDGVYLDGTSWPWLCNNTEHGCGYIKPDGSIGGTYSISGARDVIRRIYTIVKSHKPNGQVNIHNSASMVIPALGWATSTWDGEQFGSIARGVDMHKLFPLDTFRTEFMGRQWGPLQSCSVMTFHTQHMKHSRFHYYMMYWLEEWVPGLRRNLVSGKQWKSSDESKHDSYPTGMLMSILRLPEIDAMLPCIYTPVKESCT